jgi:hypothetical protein
LALLSIYGFCLPENKDNILQINHPIIAKRLSELEPDPTLRARKEEMINSLPLSQYLISLRRFGCSLFCACFISRPIHRLTSSGRSFFSMAKRPGVCSLWRE